ncbi:MAG: hypothetical protein RSG57_02540, partial [Christensenellaceae bacterium]
DEDLAEYGACFCALYISPQAAAQKKIDKQIPDRRKLKKSQVSFPIWRCTVCGYLCAKNYPPEICPICKTSKERFSLYKIGE